MNTKTSLLVALAIVTSFLVFTPTAAADDTRVCDPTNAVCVVQNDGSPGDPECDDGYLSSYGVNQKSTGVYVDAGAATAYAQAHETCGHWFLHDQHSYGVNGGAEAGGVSARAYWSAYDTTANPSCNWGAQDRDGTVLGVTATYGAGTYGVVWRDDTTSACGGGSGTETCTTDVFTGALGQDQEIGCPVGAPPSPPSPDVFPYGGP